MTSMVFLSQGNPPTSPPSYSSLYHTTDPSRNSMTHKHINSPHSTPKGKFSFKTASTRYP